MITDGERTVCVAGVMGCKNTEVTNETKNIVLESAVFRPLSIRRTSSRLGLRSEASIRYERGVDLNQSLEAVNYACYLLEKYAGGKVLKGYVHQGIEQIEDKEIILTEQFIEDYLGIHIPMRRIDEICRSLSFQTEVNDKEMKVFVPNRRLDITIKQDLVEEIARIYGYDKLNETIPSMNVSGGLTEIQKSRRTVRHIFSDLGWNECITYSLISPKYIDEFLFPSLQHQEPIVLSHPMSEEHSVLRKSLLPSLIHVVKYNEARKMTNNAFFEIAKKYYSCNNMTYEENLFSGIITGETPKTMWKGNHEKVDFFYVKGVLDTLFTKLRIHVKYIPLDEDIKELHPKRTAKIIYNNQIIGFVGELHPKYAKDNNLEEVYVFEICLDTITSTPLDVKSFTPISKVPSVEPSFKQIIS